MLRSILVVLSCRHALPHDSNLLRPMRAMHKNEGINTHDHTFIPLMQISITSRNCAEASIRSKHQIFQRITLLALGLGGRFATLGAARYQHRCRDFAHRHHPRWHAATPSVGHAAHDAGALGTRQAVARLHVVEAVLERLNVSRRSPGVELCGGTLVSPGLSRVLVNYRLNAIAALCPMQTALYVKSCY